MAIDPQLELPRPFGPYTLLRRLAVGGMAEVYVATARGIGGFEKRIAIKVIHPRYSEDDHFVQMLVEEAKISVLLTHVNIAQTFDLGRIDETYYIAMEFIEGADAYRVVKAAAEKQRALPIEVCAYLAGEVCNGLDYAHRKRDAQGNPLGIVHRDISPQNVLVSYAGEVKIVDFGIAKAASRSSHTEVGVIKGKYYYMSPEQAWGDPMDHRSDVFSTGVVLYELLTGKMLYSEENIPLLLDRVRKANVPRPELRRPSIPKSLSDIVMKSLAREPKDRFQSAQEMSQALMGFLYSGKPAFSTSRLVEVMNALFPNEVPRNSTVGMLPRSEEALPPIEPPAPEVPLDDSSEEPTRLGLSARPRGKPQQAARSRVTAETKRIDSEELVTRTAVPEESTISEKGNARASTLRPVRKPDPSSVQSMLDSLPPVEESRPSRVLESDPWDDATRLKPSANEGWEDDSTLIDSSGEVAEVVRSDAIRAAGARGAVNFRPAQPLSLRDADGTRTTKKPVPVPTVVVGSDEVVVVMESDPPRIGPQDVAVLAGRALVEGHAPATRSSLMRDALAKLFALLLFAAVITVLFWMLR